MPANRAVTIPFRGYRLKQAITPSIHSGRHLLISLLLFAVTLAVYVTLRSNIFNGDGLGYARIVELADANKLFSISARLLYCPAGRIILEITRFLGIDVRSVYLLQFMNSVFGALGVAVMFLTAYRLDGSVNRGLLAAIGLGSSLGYWFWCTNATSYPGNVFFLIVTIYLLTRLTRTDNIRAYAAISVLIGLSHALAGFFWLTALLLVPAVAFGIVVGGSALTARTRIAAAVGYLFSLSLFLFLPLLIAAFATGGISSVSDFPGWLTAASYGIPPELSLINISRGVIGFSSSLFRLVDIGPVVKQIIWGTPFLTESTIRIYLEIAMFTILWIFIAAVFVRFIRHRKRALTADGRLLLILCVWALIPALFGLMWLGSDTERWLALLPVFWLVVTQPDTRRSGKNAFIWLFVVMMLIFNLAFFAIPDHNPKNNRYMESARALDTQMQPGDLVLLWGHDNVFTGDHLTYFFSHDAIHIGQVGRETPKQAFPFLRSEIDMRLDNRQRVFVNGRIFLEEDLPESHVSDSEANISRAQYGVFLSGWDRTVAFNLGRDTYWLLQQADTNAVD